MSGLARAALAARPGRRRPQSPQFAVLDEVVADLAARTHSGRFGRHVHSRGGARRACLADRPARAAVCGIAARIGARPGRALHDRSARAGQVPAAQTLPPVHAMAQLPQFSLSSGVSTQAPTQFVSVRVARRLAGAVGCRPAGVALGRQAPQWSSVARRSTQAPPQFVAVAECTRTWRCCRECPRRRPCRTRRSCSGRR